jgi:hypothetical protein
VAQQYHALLEAEKSSGRVDTNKPFLRGGIWRNFMSRYPEANWMHKRMLEVSIRYNALPAQQRTPAMQEHLHRAQANDAYWHGLFGGLYLPHLRRAVWNNLLALEAALDALAPAPTSATRDIDCDGHNELILKDSGLLAIVRDDGDAALVELSSLTLTHNFGDTLRRTAEAYHAKIELGASSTSHEGEGITSAHDRVAFLHEIAPADAEPDLRPRGICVDTWIAADGTRHAVDHYRPVVQTSAFVAESTDDSSPWRIEKSYRMEAGTVVIDYRVEGTGRLETQLNLAMPSCDGYGGRYVLHDGSIPCGFGQTLVLDALSSVKLEDGELGGALQVAVSPAPTFHAEPHRTVSQSEAGFEKVMQAACVTLGWQVSPAIKTFRVALSVVAGT